MAPLGPASGRLNDMRPSLPPRALLLLGTLTGCAMSTSAGLPDVGETLVSDATFTVDRIGVGADTLSPDGTMDAVFEVEVNGPVVALVLSNVDPENRPLYDQVWDTIVGDEPFPAGIGAHFERGGQTAVLGVEEGGVLLNRPDGSLPPLSAGPHALRLYASPVADLVPIAGGYFYYRVTAVLEDGTLVYGDPVRHP